MPISSIIVLAIMALVIYATAWGRGYKHGWKDANKLTTALVNDILTRAGEMEEMNDDRVDAAPESGSEKN